MNNEQCPICEDPASCKGYPALWERLRRPDGHRWRPRHDRLNAGKPDYPSVAEMAGNAAKAAVAFVASGGAMVGQAEKDRRLDVCRACDRFEAAAGRCRECGCRMNWKARIESLDCPLGRW
jgi:hypothetical protein